MITDDSQQSDPFISARGERRDAYPGADQQQTHHVPPERRVDVVESIQEEDDAKPDPESSYSRVVTDDAPVYGNKCSRICVMILAGLFAAAGTGIAILGRIELDHKVLPVCPDCANFATAMYITGGSVAFFGLIGIAAAVTRLKPLAFFYAFLLFLLAVLCFACGVAIVVFELGLKKSEVRRVWVQEVSDERRLVCDLQSRLQCSGFDACCGVIDVNAPIAPSNTFCNLTAHAYLEQCDDACTDTNQQNREPCDARVTDLIKSHFKPLIGTAFGLTVVLFAGVVMSVRMALFTVPARRSINP
jgi:hypothetical protein